MKYVLSAALIAAVVSLNAQQVFHDPDAQVRNVGAFHSIEVSSAIELQLSQGNVDAVAVSANNKEKIDEIKTEVRNGNLKIWLDNKSWFNHHSGKVRAYVSVKSLDGLGASGASQIEINGILNAGALSLKMSGASDFKGEVKADALEVVLSGASDLEIRGSSNNLSVQASGASNLKGYDFVADNCLVHASGASNVNLTANKVINADASGASNVYYKGTGQEGKVKSSGASSVSKKG